MKFFKPNWVKVILFVSLASLFLSLRYNFSMGHGLLFTLQGWPLPIHNPDFPDELRADLPKSSLIWPKIYLVVDLIFWYLISCLMVWIYGKFKKKSQ